VVHSSAVAATSAPFEALVNGDLIEAKQRSAELKDVEPDDFVRFLEYAYRRDYTPPVWTHDASANNAARWPELLVAKELTPPPAVEEPLPTEPPPDDAARQEVEHQTDSYQTFPDYYTSLREGQRGEFDRLFLNSFKRNNKQDERIYDMTALRIKFHLHNSLRDENETPNADMLKGFEPKANSAADQDFTPIFLAHARLYTFADMRMIYPLKSLALHKLYKTLAGFQLYNQRVCDIVKLARYAYDHGPDRSTEGTVDSLRQLVVEYMACEVETVGKHVDFKALLEEAGEFATDFWGVVFQYLLKT
jgi:hypothetical protein